MSERLGVVFVHGFLSSAATWTPFLRLIETDVDLDFVDPYTFEYPSPPVSLHPLRRIPDINDIADSLRTYLTHDLGDRSRLVLVAHSQGGLVAQRMIARTLAGGCGPELARIRRVVLFACPNSGSDLALLLRRGGLWRHPQERELRPLNQAISDAHRIVVNQVIHATAVTAATCPIPIVAYAGESDGVVTPVSARSVFPEVGVLPGDHFSIIKPDSHGHRSYVALKRHLKEASSMPDVPAPRQSSEQLSPATRSAPVAADGYRALVDRLLAVPRMTEPTFREQVYDLLPPVIVHQLRRDTAARVELFSLVRSFEHYRHLAPGDSLASALETLVPNHPAVADVIDALYGVGLYSPSERR
ncbi:alpha/beta fold hydrolase [Micromonospora profundi]|uniref:alpha/beta fold hydrolase n=1 Tax=Micromonospora TaxID=1873 RepID=UPI0006AE9ABD|nr:MULTISPECIES: alpha/beta fold hydrolase [Micromonospora]NJC13784.1 pimeloyl-ACP methyl ester carboxylesterase [Micromonospora profundi]